MTAPKIMTVYGTRPEAIKVAPVLVALQDDPRFESVPVSTGQHREMLDQVHSMFGITPSYDLDLMKPGQSLNELVSRALVGLDAVIAEEKPDVIISQGDTSTAMAAALAGFNAGATVVHLEAGLRTGNILSPFPEECNRRVIGQVASLHLAPTAESRDNLLREAFDPKNVVVTGNTVIDALLQASQLDSEFADPALAESVASGNRMVLVTTHRRENLAAMSQIGEAVAELATIYPDTVFALPLHLNPKVRTVVLPHVEELENVVVTNPLPYDQFTRLMGQVDLVLTDSGGVQEEAPSLGKPVLVMRENTERPEAVTAGTVKLVGTFTERIVSESRVLLDNEEAYARMANAVNPYGDGHGADRAIAAVAQLTGVGARVADFDPVIETERWDPDIDQLEVSAAAGV